MLGSFHRSCFAPRRCFADLPGSADWSRCESNQVGHARLVRLSKGAGLINIAAMCRERQIQTMLTTRHHAVTRDIAHTVAAEGLDCEVVVSVVHIGSFHRSCLAC